VEEFDEEKTHEGSFKPSKILCHGSCGSADEGFLIKF
jgi:hypothetical protein